MFLLPIDTMDTHQLPNPRPRLFNPWRDFKVEIILYMISGLIQTLASYFVFDRAGDHEYFVGVANGEGVAMQSVIDNFFVFKEIIRELVFYLLATPSRLLGGGDLTHLLWMRLLSLLGFLCAYVWVRRACMGPWAESGDARALKLFLILCLIYPGQLAWTGSLLRDGVACALLFMGLLAWSNRHRLLSVTCLLGSLALRPEFALVISALSLSIWLGARLNIKKYKFVLLGSVLIFLALFLYDERTLVSEFSQLAFEEGGMAYPTVASRFDIVGYIDVLVQAMLDPLTVGTIRSGTLFQLAEVGFFILIIGLSLRALAGGASGMAAIITSVMACMWLFAYFEVFVSGFSRHRMSLVVLLIALVSVHRVRKANRGEENNIRFVGPDESTEATIQQ